MTDLPISIDDVRSAAARIQGVAHRTPVLTSRTLDHLAGARVYLKCENFQRVGAFKFRGAYNAASRLSRDQLTTGVATYSSGNHAQALALATRELGGRVVVLMPADTPESKMAAARGYGAEIVTYDRYTQDRVALGAELASDRGLTLIPPYEHLDVMAGQGTAALELIEDVGPLDELIVPIGGGGLMAGTATAATALVPTITMTGVEPILGNDTQQSLAAGHRVKIEVPSTIADGLAADCPGELTFAVNQRLVTTVVVVTDDEIIEAMRFAFERMRIVIEPSGAVGLAAVLARKVHGHSTIGIVISGGNIDARRFSELMGRKIS